MKCDGSVKLVLPPHRIYVRYDTGIISFVHNMEKNSRVPRLGYLELPKIVTEFFLQLLHTIKFLPIELKTLHTTV